MKLKRIGLIGSVFTFAICFIFASGTLLFAQCPEDYPADCEDGWCCEDPLICLLPTDLKKFVCTKQEAPCPSVELYGTHSKEAELLRSFRDNILSHTPVGQAIITLYYEMSPAIVNAMEEDATFKEEIRELVDGVVVLIGGEE